MPAPFTLPLTNPFLTHSIKQYADSFYPYPICNGTGPLIGGAPSSLGTSALAGDEAFICLPLTVLCVYSLSFFIFLFFALLLQQADWKTCASADYAGLKTSM